MKNKMRPESLMMSHGYKPELSEGSVKPPIFQTSTFAFRSAEEGKAYFELAYGIREKSQNEELGLIYSRINNPNLEILEDRLCLWDQAESCATFESGMSAISTVLLEFLKPGDLLLYSQPTYGGTDHFINHYLKDIGVHTIGFTAKDSRTDILEKINAHPQKHKLSLVYIESPANPTNDIIDIAMLKDIAKQFEVDDKEIPVAVDNTYMGPVWCSPLKHGADLVIYSATKYIGGHSDLIAGVVLGHYRHMLRVRTLRTFLGNMASPHTCWLLMRSLETLKIRMDRQAKNAQEVAAFLKDHPKVEQVFYLGLLTKDHPQYSIYKKQYSAPGAMISFTIKGGEAEAFQFLNNLKLIKLAVSLGGTESLIQHPASMTHIGVDPEKRLEIGITENLIRLSVGIEHPDDLIQDIKGAFEAASNPMIERMLDM